MQFNKQDVALESLDRQCIDTGMGLERLVAVVEGKTDNYKTSLFDKLILNAREIYQNNNEEDELVFRIAADHIRSTAFLIADGVLPSNIGRGYVLRRIMRRCMKYLHKIDDKNIKMHKLIDALTTEMGSQYTEIVNKVSLIKSTIKQEEEGFKNTLSRGLKILQEKISLLNGEKILSGGDAFILYDTYGFPLDLTQNILEEQGLTVNEVDFDKALEEQKSRGRASWKGSDSSMDRINDFCTTLGESLFNTEHSIFVGYDKHTVEAKVIKVFSLESFADIIEVKKDVEFCIIANQTVCYPEGGGQTGDSGTITLLDVELSIRTTKKQNNIIIHYCIADQDITIPIGEKIVISYNQIERQRKTANHSLTHLLQSALRLLYGKQVSQKGSQIYSDRFRFDFNHDKPISKEEISQIENTINDWIDNGFEVSCKNMLKEDAIKLGATANFGEKYGDNVRVVEMISSNKNILSLELCGGTHVANSSKIHHIKIVSAKSIGSGLKRIECKF